MSRPDMREIIDLKIDFIVQNTINTTLQCHYTDGWGPSPSDRAGQEGLQDCLLARYQLCAQHGLGAPAAGWFDFTACLYRNQAATDKIDDGMKAFNETVEYCAGLQTYPLPALKGCAEGPKGLALLEASHAMERRLNSHADTRGHHHPDWIIIGDHDYANNATIDWLHAICAAYTGQPKPSSCSAAGQRLVTLHADLLNTEAL